MYEPGNVEKKSFKHADVLLVEYFGRHLVKVLSALFFVINVLISTKTILYIK